MIARPLALVPRLVEQTEDDGRHRWYGDVLVDRTPLEGDELLAYIIRLDGFTDSTCVIVNRRRGAGDDDASVVRHAMTHDANIQSCQRDRAPRPTAGSVLGPKTSRPPLAPSV